MKLMRDHAKQIEHFYCCCIGLIYRPDDRRLCTGQMENYPGDLCGAALQSSKACSSTGGIAKVGSINVKSTGLIGKSLKSLKSLKGLKGLKKFLKKKTKNFSPLQRR